MTIYSFLLYKNCELELEDKFPPNNWEFEIEIAKMTPCKACQGTGKNDGKECLVCRGHGKVPKEWYEVVVKK